MKDLVGTPAGHGAGGAEDVVGGYIVVFQQRGRVLEVDVLRFSDVPERVHAMICRISVPGLLIPVGRPDATGAGCLECVVKTADTAEEIDEGGLIPRA